MAELISCRWPGETWIAEGDGNIVQRLELLRDNQPLALGSIHLARYQGEGLVEIGGSVARLIVDATISIGSSLMVEVVREPIPEPGQIKPARVKASAESAPTTAGVVLPGTLNIFQVEAVETLIDEAITGLWPFPGGMLCAERTRAGLIIDVDGSGQAIEVNRAAAVAIARRLRLYQVGGMVIVDFISLPNQAERRQLDVELATALAQDPRPVARTATNGYGIAQIIRPRPRASIIDMLCGTRRQVASDVTLALQLLRDVVRARGVGPRTIHARPAVAALLQAWPKAVSEAARCCGAPVVISADEMIRDAGHIHVHPH